MMNFANENLDWLAQVREGLERSIKKCMDQAVPYKRQLVSYSVGARCAYRSRRRLPLLWFSWCSAVRPEKVRLLTFNSWCTIKRSFAFWVADAVVT